MRDSAGGADEGADDDDADGGGAEELLPSEQEMAMINEVTASVPEHSRPMNMRFTVVAGFAAAAKESTGRSVAGRIARWNRHALYQWPLAPPPPELPPPKSLELLEPESLDDPDVSLLP